MPDPERKTISATEVPALFNASPYITKWMLYHKFASGMNIDSEPNERMNWGTKMQPLILAQVAEDKKLEVIPNIDDTYIRRGLIGCTRDATIICPDRGPGALEIKCVFDYRVWATNWQGGNHVPRHNEIQLQTQMYVGDCPPGWDRPRTFEWGMIAVWVCAELHYFERVPINSLWSDMVIEADCFFADVGKKNEPDAFGVSVEAPFITAMYPLVAGKELDLSNDPAHVKTSQDVSMYQTQKDMAAGNKRVTEELRIKLLALARDAQLVRLPCGVNYRVQKSGSGKTIVPFIPEVLSPPPQGEVNLGF